jgi:hypothetical protein
VSASTIGLVVLAHHTLEEACRLRDSAPQWYAHSKAPGPPLLGSQRLKAHSPHSHSAHTLQQTARDLFDLYRAIMPLQYQVRRDRLAG